MLHKYLFFRVCPQTPALSLFWWTKCTIHGVGPFRFRLLAGPKFPAQGSSTTKVFAQGRFLIELRRKSDPRDPISRLGSDLWGCLEQRTERGRGLAKPLLKSHLKFVTVVINRIDWLATNEKRMEQRHERNGDTLRDRPSNSWERWKIVVPASRWFLATSQISKIPTFRNPYNGLSFSYSDLKNSVPGNAKNAINTHRWGHSSCRH